MEHVWFCDVGEVFWGAHECGAGEFFVSEQIEELGKRDEAGDGLDAPARNGLEAFSEFWDLGDFVFMHVEELESV